MKCKAGPGYDEVLVAGDPEWRRRRRRARGRASGAEGIMGETDAATVSAGAQGMGSESRFQANEFGDLGIL